MNGIWSNACAILEDAQIKAALSVFNAATVVHDYMVIRLASGQPVPTPIQDETEKHFVDRLTKLASEAVGDWIIGVGMRLNITVPVPTEIRRYALHAADVTMPDPLHLIAKCERHGKPGDACGIRYGDLLPRKS